MPILNRSKIRPDVLKLYDDVFKEQMNGVIEFISREENKEFNFQTIYKKVMDANELFFKREKSVEELNNILTKKERLFMVKLLRYAFEYGETLAQKKSPIPDDVKIEKIIVNGIPAEWQIVPGAEKSRVLLYFHGGGWIMGSPNTCRLLTIELANATKMHVLSVDYRLAPEHPFPAAVEDCVAVYKWLLSNDINPEDIIISGDSAGGNLTLATLIKLRDDGIPLPAGAIPISPATDLSFVDDISSLDDLFIKNGETDPILADLGIYWWSYIYIAGANSRDPLISPVFGDLTRLPPILIQASSCEMLYSEIKRFFEKAKEAGVDVELQTWDDMVHVFQGFGLHILPEAEEAIKKISQFVQKLI
ncbi:MAG: alpha/beta hydrolase [Candidatus Hodarchaeota archaeon]